MGDQIECSCHVWDISLQTVDQRIPRDLKTINAITIALCHPSELNGKTLLLKTPDMGHKTWQNEARIELEASSLMANFHISRRH